VLNWDCTEDEDLIHLPVWLNPSDLLFVLTSLMCALMTLN